MNATATQIASKTEYRLVRCQSESDESKSYYLLVRKSDGIATDCNCGDRIHRGRKSHRSCKHMKKFNSRVVLQGLADWMSGFAITLQSMQPVTPLEQRAGTVSLVEAVDVLEQYAAECDDMYGKLAETKHVEPTVESSLSPFLKSAMAGKSHNGQLSGHVA